MNTKAERRRILVIDDNDAIHGDFRKTLESRTPTERLANAAAMLFGKDKPKGPGGPSFDVDSALQGREGFEKVKGALAAGDPYALAFVDMRMPPGWDGVETVKHLWEADPELQVVICTAYSDYSWEQITDALGTTDRLLILKKPFDPIEVCQLAAALSEKWKLKHQAALKMSDLEKMVHSRTAELQRLAMTDKLTGLPNRAYLLEQLKSAVAKTVGDAGYRFAVHFLDFDRFKVINDSLGHNAGDQLLIGIAERLTKVLDSGKSGAADGAEAAPGSIETGFVATRLGGDEFVVLQYGIQGIGDATALADKLLEALGASYVVNEMEVHSTVSIGIATSENGYQWGDDILRDADSAMYRAKSQGRARYAIFSPEMHQQAMKRITLESDLRRAIQRRELMLHYQPIIALEDGRLLGFEALARWAHPVRGMIGPSEFIPVAEEAGIIGELGQWVLEEAVGQLARWAAKMPEAPRLEMSVNCSRRQIADPRFTKSLGALLAKTDIRPQQVNLEVTESVMMNNPQEIRELLLGLKELGVGLQMDDFGTGYSSLHCLHELRLDVLKIDQSFIRHVSLRRDYAAVIHAIIQLAHNLEMKVVAEGVELPEHVAILSGLDCDAVQGFLFAKPMSADEAETYIRTQMNRRHTMAEYSLAAR